MGNCLQKTFGRKPNQPADISQVPPTERVTVIRNPHPQKTSEPLPWEISLGRSNTKKAVKDTQIPQPLKVSVQQHESNPCVSSYSQTEKLSQDERYSSNDRFKVNVTDEVIHAYKVHEFCYSTLKLATKKFSRKNLLGMGGCGEVYKGWIDYSTMKATKPHGQYPIAVKRLRKEGDGGRGEWLSELKFLSRFHHPHVVKLIGYCCEANHRILVYEFMPKGSLEAHLLRGSDTELSWKRRVKVAVGSAKGLEYLHTVGSIIHRDIKSSNILLDNDFTPKISDFGLAKLGPQGDKTHVTTRVLGTRGYFAPEYVYTGHLTLKTDVYGFGVVLLEILSGSGPVKRHSGGVAGDLAQWAKPYLSNKQELHRVTDKKLRKKVHVEEAYEFAEIILKCLDPNPKGRPTMTEVVNRLEQLEQNMNKRNQKSVRISTSTQKCLHSSIKSSFIYVA